MVAVVDAVKADDQAKLVAIFGSDAGEAMNSGNPVADQRARDLFVAAYNERAVLVDEAGKQVLHIGSEDWPFPIPLVKEDAGWRFDTAAGIDELRYRRIGRNELATIGVCEAYVAAQQEYAQKGHDGKPAGLYAQKFASDAGTHNGLYWEAKPGEAESPLGELAAEAAAEGYTRPSEKLVPFRGYYFRILTAQGASAEGGAKSYLVNGAHAEWVRARGLARQSRQEQRNDLRRGPTRRRARTGSRGRDREDRGRDDGIQPGRDLEAGHRQDR